MAMKKADVFAEQGDWDEAVLRYRDAYKAEPSNLDYKMKYLNARFEAGMMHYDRGEAHVGEGDYKAAAIEFRSAIILEPGLGKAARALEKVKRVLESDSLYGKGVELIGRGNVREAKPLLKKAVALNPDNHAAAAQLEKIQKERGLIIDGYELALKSSAPITIEFRDANLKRVFEVISRLSGINFVFDSDVKDEKTSVLLKDATFQQALDLILVTNKLSRKVISENTIIIYPSLPMKAAQYEEMVIKVFYLTNIDAKKAVNLIKSMLKIKDVMVQEELNALVVRAKPEAIELAQKILNVTDLSSSEVMLEVNIMEVNRKKASNLGLDLTPDTITAAVPTTDGTITLGELGHLSSADLLMGLPSAVLNIKKEDLDARVLANPKIRVRNNEKARVHIGERVPIITTTVNQGVSTENIQYQDVGLKLLVEPIIRQDDEVEIKLGLEVSTLGTKTVTNSGSVVFQIGTRNIDTVLRLRDGETEVIGGLINDEERTTTAKVPLLGEIPVIGRLFSNLDENNASTEILLSITPRIIKRLDVPEESATGFHSGIEADPSAGHFMEEIVRDAAPDGAMETGPVVDDTAPAPVRMPFDLPPPPPPLAPPSPGQSVPQ